jgi:hypothetical protein
MANSQTAINSLPINNIKPLTLTIAPRAPVQSTISQIKIPNFNHVPINPSIIPNPSNVPATITPEDKEKSRLEKQCQRVKRYNEKVKAYKKIALLDSNHEKIKALLLICYPELSQMGQYELDMRIIRIIQSLSQPL